MKLDLIQAVASAGYRFSVCLVTTLAAERCVLWNCNYIVY